MGAITLRSLAAYSPLRELARATNVHRLPPPLRRTRRVFGIRTTVARFDGSVYYVPDYAAHRPVARNILGKRYVSPRLHELVQRVMASRPGNLISAGTFFGDMLPSFSRKTPGLVYAFEPVLENYLLARAIVDDNVLPNVVLLHAGLGAEAGVADIGISRKGRPHLGGAARVISDAQKAEFVSQRAPLLAIDQLGIADLSMIQLDVEGYELPALQGATRTITAQQPVIVIEDNARNCAAFLADLGYAEVGQISRDHVYVPEAAAARVTDFLPSLESVRI